MYFPDCLRLGLDFDPAGLSQDLSVAATEGWRRHYNRSDYDGEWQIIALRAAAEARHPVQRVFANPLSEHFADTPLLALCPHFRGVLAAFACPLRSARLMRLGPGSRIKEHRDDFLDVEDGVVRLHVPVVTNDGVDFRLNGVRVEMRPGTTWYLNVGAPHSVANLGASERVHLVIDAVLDKWLVELFELAEKARDSAYHPD